MDLDNFTDYKITKDLYLTHTCGWSKLLDAPNGGASLKYQMIEATNHWLEDHKDES